MSTKVIAAIIAVVVIGGGAYYYSTKNTNTDVAGESQSAEMVSGTNVETASLKSLIESGKTRKCTYQSNEGGVNTSGVMYSSNNKMRGDITIDLPETKSQSITHMIYDGGTSYMWTHDSKTGFKMSLDQSAQVETKNKSVDLDKDYNFKCEDWSVDQSKFELPSDVQFSDMGTFTGTDVNAAASAAANAGSLDTKEAQQAVCNSLPEVAKAACLKSMQ